MQKDVEVSVKAGESSKGNTVGNSEEGERLGDLLMLYAIIVVFLVNIRLAIRRLKFVSSVRRVTMWKGNV